MGDILSYVPDITNNKPPTRREQVISRMAEEVKRKLRFKQYIYNQKQKKIAHLCINCSPGKCLTIASVGYRPLRAGVEGEEAKVENEESEAAEGD